jgi:hypothetical protein
MQNKINFLGLLILLSTNCFRAFAQDDLPVPIKENSIYYEEVVKDQTMGRSEFCYYRKF